MRKVIEVIYNDLSNYVASDIVSWKVADDILFFCEASNLNKTTFIPIGAIKSYSVEEVPDKKE